MVFEQRRVRLRAAGGGRAAEDRGPGDKDLEQGRGLAELLSDHVALKGDLKAAWVPHDVRDEVVDFVNRWSARTEVAVVRLTGWLGVRSSKF